ncbi:hypothetical protein NDU88_000784 [Pleurodeles waltl]|uniref:Uncharacterized protein n=1 Tax=Pleurodeles waltl TaxID=8319 RepID=A0AAV7S8J8_PLEWA|nr:hypothetical protein NDU88_000784 [Pleurodeles waltl]
MSPTRPIVPCDHRSVINPYRGYADRISVGPRRSGAMTCWPLLPIRPRPNADIMENSDSANLPLELAQTGISPVVAPLHMVKAHFAMESQPADPTSLIVLARLATNTVKMHLGCESDKEGFQKSADSLTEPNGTNARSYSEANSSGCTQSKEEENVSSDLGTSLSSAIGPTVKQQQRQRRHIKERSGSLSSASAVGPSAATLKWDYSGISLCSQEKGPETLTALKDIGEGRRGDDSTGSTEKTMLQMIHGTIKELQTETRTESRRARLATKQLQVTVRKVGKT